jgi:hypothetical protein
MDIDAALGRFFMPTTDRPFSPMVGMAVTNIAVCHVFFDGPMVLLSHVVQRLDLTDLGECVALSVHRVHRLDSPAVHRGMIDRNPTLGHHFLEMTQAKRIGNVLTHAGQHYFQRIVQPFKHPCHTRIQRLHSSPMRPFRSRHISRTTYCDKSIDFAHSRIGATSLWSSSSRGMNETMDLPEFK